MIGEVIILRLSVALLTKVVVFAVSALKEVTHNRFLSTVLAVNSFMSNALVGISCSRLLLKLKWS